MLTWTGEWSSTRPSFPRHKNPPLSKEGKTAIGVNTYGTCIATILQGCLILVLFPRPVLPQAIAASVGDGSVQIEVNVNDVVFPVVVRDAPGRAVGNLKKEDFAVFDQGKPQVISGFKIQTRSTPRIGAQTAESTSTRRANNRRTNGAIRRVAISLDRRPGCSDALSHNGRSPPTREPSCRFNRHLGEVNPHRLRSRSSCRQAYSSKWMSSD